MRKGLCAVAFVVLLLAGTLAASMPAAAQEPEPAPGGPLICFQGEYDPDNLNGGVNGPFDCGVDQRPGNFLEGDKVHIQLRNLQGASPMVRTSCVTGCLDGPRDYYARYDPSRGRVIFPDDFHDDAGVGAPSASGERQPKYNGTWRVSVLLGEAHPSRDFNTWLYTGWTAQNWTVRPGEEHAIRSWGHDGGATVSYTLERRVANGSLVTVHHNPNLRAASNGAVFLEWDVPKHEAAAIRECPRSPDPCYQIRIAGAGKAAETVGVRVGLAEIKPSIMNHVYGGPALNPTRMQRTMNATVAVDLHYPGGRGFQGDRFMPEDLPDGLAEKVLRVAVERYNVTTGETRHVETIPMTYVSTRFRWEAVWTPPKDLALPDGQDFRLRLLQAPDKWGNLVKEHVLGHYRVHEARLAPTVVQNFTSLERTREGEVGLRILYHNGTPLEPGDNATPLEGCFERVTRGPDGQPAPPTCGSLERVRGEYRNGTWWFKVRYPRDYANLDEHRFVFLGGESRASDRWGNSVNGTIAQPFVVAIAQPRVDFTTVLRGRATDTLERNSVVHVQAVVRYHDGQPFNASTQPYESRVLEGTLTKRGPNGHVVREDRFNLTLADAREGRWQGSLALLRDDTSTPLGDWTFAFHVRDNLTTPNENFTSFNRSVVAAPVLLDVLREPVPAEGYEVPTGAELRFRFRLRYEGGGYVDAQDNARHVAVQVYRFGPDNRTHWGDPISGQLQPRAVGADEFEVAYPVATHLFGGRYVLRVTGGDAAGNLLQQDAYSNSFTTRSPVVERSVVTQPPEEVQRGEAAVVVFTGIEGDTGITAEGRPAIRVERHDATRACAPHQLRDPCWVVVREDAREVNPEIPDHVGVFPVTTSTPIGTYRFVLEGREPAPGFRVVRAVSQNFTVDSSVVTRPLVLAPPEKVVKGEAFFFSVQTEPGDRFLESQVLLNGRAVTAAPPVLSPRGSLLNVTWLVPFDAPTGNYTLRLRGLDPYGNTIEVVSPFVDAQPADLQGKVIGNPSRVVARGEQARVLFGITYPNGQFYMASDVPRVTVVNASGFVAEAQVRREGITFQAIWTPDVRTPAGEYSFEVSGQGSDGNVFPTLSSQPFRVAPGTVTRGAAQDVAPSNDRMSTITFAVPFLPDDRFASFEIGYFGPTSDVSAALFATREPLSVAPLAHTVDAATGRYVARFVTDQQTAPGAYRIYMTGEDGNGNKVEASSLPFLLKTTGLIVSWEHQPPSDAFKPGQLVSLSFTVKYRTGPQMDDTLGKPSAALLLNGQPVEPRPTVEYREGRWWIDWQAPDTIPDGTYTFTVGGSDAHGNPIGTTSSQTYPVLTPLTGSFAKVIPGPSPALLVLAAAALALGLARWTARRRA